MRVWPAVHLLAAITAGLAGATFLGGPATPAAPRWEPQPSDRLHIQFTEALQVPQWASVVEVDSADTSAQTVADLHARGLRVACYISAGSVEDFRADAPLIPTEVIGSPLQDWPDEHWLDVRRIDLLAPVMRARINECADKGFDAIEFDNVDSWTHQTGFPLTRTHSLRYLRWLIRTGHEHGLAVGLKNATDLIEPLADEVDWALNEQCAQFDECDRYAPLVRRNVPVFVLEYNGRRARACATVKRFGLIGQMKHLNLGAWARPC